MTICGVCGKTSELTRHIYGEFHEIKSIYRVGFKYVCTGCGKRADSFVNYYGYKSEQDKQALHQFLISGVLPMRDYSALVNAGYF